MSVAIDYSASNGDPEEDSKSLHKLNIEAGGEPN